MSTAVFAQGTLLKPGNGASPEVFTTMPGCEEIAYGPPSPDEIDVTSHSSSGGFREYIAGLLGKGKVSTKVFYNPSEATHVQVRQAHGTYMNFQLAFVGSPAETVTFNARVDIALANPVDKAREMSVELAITGVPVWS
jgi:predicted secreted protein